MAERSQSRNPPPHIIIIGGGISGLAAAERLAREPEPPRVTVLESGERFGGVIATERVDGFVIEQGPDVLLASKPAALELAARVGLASRVIPTVAGRSYVVSRGRLRRLPEGMSGLVPTSLGSLLTTPLLSPWARVRAAAEALMPRPRGREVIATKPHHDQARPPRHESRVTSHDEVVEESIRDFVVRRFGSELYDRLAEPLLTGVVAGDGARLSLDATFPRLRQLEREHGSVLRGLVAARRQARPVNAPMGFVSFRDGMGELPNAIARWLRGSSAVEQRLRCRVTRIDASGAGYSVHLASGASVAAEAIVLATPAPVTAQLLAGIDDCLASQLAAIEHTSTVVVTLGIPASGVLRALDATGYVVPRIEQRQVLACTWSSAKFADRAPAGFALFRLFLGGAGREEIVEHDDQSLVRIASAELTAMLGITAAPVLTRVVRWRRTMPQYTVGHLARVAAIEARLAAHPRLAIAGNALTGVGIPDCVRSGQRAAERLLANRGQP